MKYAVFILLPFFFVEISASGQSADQGEMRIARVTRIMPDIILDPVHGRDTSVGYVFCLRNARLFKIPTEVSEVETIPDENGNMRSKVIRTRIEFEYFLCSDKDDVVRKYDAGKEKFSLFIPANSFSTKIWLFQPVIDVAKPEIKMASVSNIRSDDGQDLFEKYKWQKNSDPTEQGTIELTFSKELNGLPYSISPALDTAKQMKLSAATFRFTSGCIMDCYKSAGFDMTEFSVSYFLQEDKSVHHPDVMRLLKNNDF